LRQTEKLFCTYYEVEPGNGIQQKAFTKETNDSFADGLGLMGVTNITKTYYDPLVRKWLPYTDRIFYAEKI
jgi:hypothetical protein